MSNSCKVLGLIPARGGSKEIPRKNIKLFAGKELIGWTIEAALNSSVISDVVVSSDDKEILEVSKKFGAAAPFIRPRQLATDEASSVDVLLHAIDILEQEYEYVALLQPTSPLRTCDDIDKAFKLMIASNSKSCVSVSASSSNPYLMYYLQSDNRLLGVVNKDDNLHRRQDLPACYELNGAIYIASIQWFKKVKSFLSKDTVAYIMNKDKSYDIDTENDFIEAEQSILRIIG